MYYVYMQIEMCKSLLDIKMKICLKRKHIFARIKEKIIQLLLNFQDNIQLILEYVLKITRLPIFIK